VSAADTWWRSAVIYQVYPRSFADANGDGIGDLVGVRTKLPYLARLGVDALWLSPFYRSPMADAGYDVADYRAVDPVFGDVHDVEALVHEAHAEGLRVIIDVVPNHTSDEHQWFREALAAGVPDGTGVAGRTRYAEGPWSRYHLLRGRGDDGAEPPTDWLGVFGGIAWSQLDDASGNPSGWWYLHLFDAKQPDLDWSSREVRDEFLSVLRFWFDRGVDGFRIDVAHGLAKDTSYPDAHGDASLPDQRPAEATDANAPGPYWDQPAVHDIFREWRAVADSYEPPRTFVGEVWVASPEAHARYLRPDELHTAFNFHHLRTPWWAEGLRETIDHSMAAAGAVGAPTTWVLENHDVWRAPTRYAPSASPDPGAGQPTVGDLRTPVDIDGVVRDLVVGTARARAGALVMLALPGSAYVYQGQELGLPEVLDLPADARQDPVFFRTNGVAVGRDGCRVPIPWAGTSPSYGFGPGTKSWLPQPASWAQLSLEAQRAVAGSTYETFRAALAVRRTEGAFGDGELAWDEHGLGRDVLSFVRPARDGAAAVRCVVNMGHSDVSLPPGIYGSEVLVSSTGLPLATGADGLVLPVDTAVWLRA
jgi:alpha-glucosidase